MRPFLAPAILTFASVFAGNVFAGSAYTAEDIVNHFAPAGSTRGTVFWSRYNGTQTAPTTSDSGTSQVGFIAAFRGCVLAHHDISCGGLRGKEPPLTHPTRALQRGRCSREHGGHPQRKPRESSHPHARLLYGRGRRLAANPRT